MTTLALLLPFLLFLEMTGRALWRHYAFKRHTDSALRLLTQDRHPSTYHRRKGL